MRGTPINPRHPLLAQGNGERTNASVNERPTAADAATAQASRKRLGRLAGWHQHAKQNESLPRVWCQPTSRAFVLSRFHAGGTVVWRER